MTLVTGGGPGDSAAELYEISGSAFEIGPPTHPNDYQGYYGLNYTDIPPEQISIGGFGNLNSTGLLYAALSPRTQVDVTPRAPANLSGIVVQGRRFEWITRCVATTPADQARTTIGVGEQVNLSWLPLLGVYTNYSVSAGSIASISSDNTVWRFTAPSNAATVTITFRLQNAVLTKTFNVLEPTGVSHAMTVARQPYAIGQAGAGMHIKPYIAPTNVSFYRVQCLEVGNDASSVTGYFTNIAVSDLTHKPPHGGDVWFQIQQDNSWPSNYDWAKSASYLPYTPGGWLGGGGFMWIIPAKWKIGSGPTNNIANGWDQVYAMGASGTMTVTKFNHTVTRHTNEIYGTVVPDP